MSEDLNKLKPYVLTRGYWEGNLRLFRVASETAKTLKAHEFDEYRSAWGGNTRTVNKADVLATFGTDAEALEVMGRAKTAWELSAGPVADAERILRERRQQQRDNWIAALKTEGA